MNVPILEQLHALNDVEVCVCLQASADIAGMAVEINRIDCYYFVVFSLRT